MPTATKARARKRAPKLETRLAAFIAKDIAARDVTQIEAARLMRDAPSQVSQVVGGHLRGFSTKRLMTMITRLGYDVRISVKKARRRTGDIRLV
jgi:predicted XRE-type DNA-binding protein